MGVLKYAKHSDNTEVYFRHSNCWRNTLCAKYRWMNDPIRLYQPAAFSIFYLFLHWYPFAATQLETIALLSA